MKWLEPLSEDSQSLLAKERTYGPEPAEVEQRVLARARAARQVAAAQPARRAFLRRPTFLLAATLVVALATVAYAAWREQQHARLGAAPPETAQRGVSAPPSPAPAPVAPSAAPSAPGTSESAEIPEKTASVAAASPAAPAAPPSSPAATYALELAILEQARAAVAKGDSAAALRAIANHQRRFPAGLLQEEREALRVKALAAAGNADEAQRAAERFRQRFPRSVLSPSIDETAKPSR